MNSLLTRLYANSSGDSALRLSERSWCQVRVRAPAVRSQMGVRRNASKCHTLPTPRKPADHTDTTCHKVKSARVASFDAGFESGRISTGELALCRPKRLWLAIGLESGVGRWMLSAGHRYSRRSQAPTASGETPIRGRFVQLSALNDSPRVPSEGATAALYGTCVVKSLNR